MLIGTKDLVKSDIVKPEVYEDFIYLLNGHCTRQFTTVYVDHGDQTQRAGFKCSGDGSGLDRVL